MPTAFFTDVVQAFRPAQDGGPEGPHYTRVKPGRRTERPHHARENSLVCGELRLGGPGTERLATQQHMQEDGERHDGGAAHENEVQPALE